MVVAIACPVPAPGAPTVLFVSFGLLTLIAVTRRLPLAVGLALPLATLAAELWLALPPREFFAALAFVAGTGAVVLAGTPLGIWMLLRCFWFLPGSLSLRPWPGRNERGDAALSATEAELGRLGFRSAGPLFIDEGLERQRRQLFVDPSGVLVAWKTFHSLGIQGLSFCSEQDGARVATSSWPFVFPLPLPPGSVTYYHHYCRDAGELLQLHRRHLADHAIDAPLPRNEERTIEDERCRYEEGLEHAVRVGCLVRDRRGRHRFTLRGIYLAAWRSLFSDFRRREFKLGR